MVSIPEFSTLKGEAQNLEENEKAYEESQTQRELERRLREEKRDLAVMKAQGAPEAAIRAQRERLGAASARIDEFCDETGRPEAQELGVHAGGRKVAEGGQLRPDAVPHPDAGQDAGVL